MYCNRHRLKRIMEVMLLSSRAKPLTSLLCDAGAGILQTPFLLCQLKSPVGSTIRGARGRQGWRRNKGPIPSCLPVCITPLFLHPSSNSSYMQFFQRLTSLIISFQSYQQSAGAPSSEFWNPGPWGQLLLKRQQH